MSEEEKKGSENLNFNPNNIKVGDEVTTKIDKKFTMLVIAINDDIATCWWEDDKKVECTKDYTLMLLIKKDSTDGPMGVFVY